MGENRPICSRVSHNAQLRLGRQGGGKGQFIEGARHGFRQAASDSVFFVLAYALTWGATPWNGFFAPGVLLAALIVVTLTEGLSGLKAPAWNASPTAHPAIAEWEEL